MAVTSSAIQPGINLSATSQTVATGSGSSTTITTAVVANSTAASIPLAVNVTRKAGGTFPVIVGRSIPANSSSIPPELAAFSLADGDTLTATGNGLALILNGFIVS
ncbi:hypothetical protein [Gluconobacter cerinus]|uniref:hypothetical protein n=1 Tax=Gluconobacter cerinus TaxID=38307 RepID=UPI001B8BCD43|nr:hypothetical protein [Gluconobacter cerinus]MBS0994764.1 hypothetical protein [Gluconobacter cerinus]